MRKATEIVSAAIAEKITLIGNEGFHIHPPATSVSNGFMTKEDRIKLDASTSEATPGELMERDSTGQAKVGLPTNPSHISRKQDLDVIDQRVSNIVAGAGASNAEIIDARLPATGPAFPVLRDRLNNADSQLVGKADKAILDSSLSSIKELSTIQNHPPYRNFFIDDFSVMGNYTAINSSGVTTSPWTVSGNTVQNPTGGTSDCFLINKDLKFSDGKVSVVFENPNTSIATSTFAGIGFRGKGYSNLLVAIIFSNTKTVELWVFANAAYSRLAFSSIDSAQFATNKPLLIDVDIVGINCVIKVNGKTYITYSDANIISYGSGYCGLIASSGVDSSAKIFSSFTVSERMYDTVPIGATNYLFLGDSITMGAGGTTPFPGLFDDLLTAYLSKPIAVTNAGVSSETTAQMLTRLVTLLAANTYNVVCIMGGTNDSRIDLSVPISTAIANISAMIKRIKSHGAIPLVCTVPPISLSITGASYGVASYNYIVKLNAQIRQLCVKEKIKCIEVFDAFNDNIATYISGDLLHPNNTGYQLIAQTVFNTVVNNY